MQINFNRKRNQEEFREGIAARKSKQIGHGSTGAEAVEDMAFVWGLQKRVS